MPKQPIQFISFVLICVLFITCKQKESSAPAQATPSSAGGRSELDQKYHLDKIKLLPGFKISVFAEVPNARSMCLSGRNTLYVGSITEGKVYAIIDKDQDGRADKVYTIASGLNTPCGVAFKDGSLFVAEINRILRFDDIEEHLDNPLPYKVVYDQFPTDKHHGWKFIAFGPDGRLYVPVGAPCNICEPKDPYATITRMNPDGSGFEIFARGIRNTVGFAWNPETRDMWFTDNGRDELGDDVPNDELNVAPKAGMNFGYPYCHEGDLLDPEFGQGKSCSNYTPPVLKLGAHVASLGLRFYTGDLFPAEYKNQLFIAEHGSWNRSKKSGYRVMLVKLQNNKPSQYVEFASGWLQPDESAFGRPADVQVAKDGALLVSDDTQGAVYRIAPVGK